MRFQSRKLLFSLTAFCLISGGVSASAAEIWGGKWSNIYMVFFEIDDINQPTEIIYKWEERLGAPLEQRIKQGSKKEGVITVGYSMHIKIMGGKAIVYGAFSRPRVANLVLLKTSDINKANLSALLDAGWKDQPMDVEEYWSRIFKNKMQSPKKLPTAKPSLPKAALKIRKQFELAENKLLEPLDSLDENYRKHLESLSKKMQLAGSFEGVLEVKQEIENLKNSKPDASQAKDPELNRSIKVYIKARHNVFESVAQQRIRLLEIYNSQLMELASSLTKSGNLDEALDVQNYAGGVKNELLAIKAGANPLGLGLYPVAKKVPAKPFAQLNRKEFAEWLQHQIFEFTGKVSGRIQLKFSNGKLAYGPTTIYPYEVSGNRRVEVDNQDQRPRFTIDFSQDLKSAIFTSKRGTYSVRINP